MSCVRDFSLAATTSTNSTNISINSSYSNSSVAVEVSTNIMTDPSCSKDTKTIQQLSGGLKYIDDVDEENVPKVSITSLNRTSRHFAPSSDSQEGSISGCEQDSGVFNSSRNTISSPSDADADADLGSDDERPGAFDYFHYANKKGAVRSSDSEIFRSHNKAYDEAYDAESDESPRSNSSTLIDSESNEGTEMQTFRVHESAGCHPYQRLEEDDDDSLHEVVVHERLYSNQSHMKFTNMHPEEDEDYEFYDCSSSNVDPENIKINFTPRSKNSMRARQSDVDQSVVFSSLNSKTYGTCDKNSTSDPGVSIQVSEMKKITKDEYKRNDDKVESDATVPLIQKMSRSRTYSFSKDKYGNLDNSKEKVNKSSDEEKNVSTSVPSSSPSKKKKKKKRQNKDDTGSDSSGSKEKASYDVNGNPQSWQTVPIRNATAIRQASSPRSFNGISRSSSVNQKILQRLPPFQFSQYNEFDINGIPLSELDGHSMSSINDSGSTSKKKRKKVKKDDSIRSENIPGYRGTEKIEDLLGFIENTGNGKKKKKPSEISSSVFPVSPTEYKSTKKGNKEKKTNKGSSTNMTKDDKSMSDSASENSIDVSTSKIPNTKNMSQISSPTVLQTNDIVTNDDTFVSDIVTNDDPFVSDNSERGMDKNDAISVSNGTDVISCDSLTDAEFRFTDFDATHFREEGEFVQVGKKKKGHNKPQPTITKDTTLPAYQHAAYSIYSQQKDNTRYEAENKQRKPYQSRSITPPPQSLIKSEKQDRDLSPSAFPALSHDGRRNSTSDVPSTVDGILPHDDSDLESVKSLPVRVDTFVDIHTNAMSYAKMAASPKPGISSVNLNQQSLQLENEFVEDSPLDGSNMKTESFDFANKNYLMETSNRLHDNAIDSGSSSNQISEKSSEKKDHSDLEFSKEIHSVRKSATRNIKSSVVFMDKKTEVPSNLGISFGFDVDENNEPPVTSTNAYYEADSQIPDAITFTWDKTKVPPNGLIVPASQQQYINLHVTNNSSMFAEQVTFTNEAPPTTGAEALSCVVTHKDLEKEMLQQAHDKVSPHSSPSEDQDAYLGTFIIEDAVKFLQKEWNRFVGKDYAAINSITYSTAWEESTFGNTTA